MVNVNCTGGGGYFSDDVSATKAQVVKGKHTVTKDQSDEVVEGTMVEVGATDAQKSNAVANSNLYLRMTNGAHRTKNQTSGYPEVYISLQTLRSTIGATDASKILTGTNIAGLAGTMVNRGAWNSTLALSGSVTIPQGWHNGSGKISRPYSTYGGGTFTPSASNQTIPTSGKFLTGNVNCKADANFIASNIKHGVTIFGVTGTYLSPIVYNGGDGTALFGSKSFTYGFNGANGDYRRGYAYRGSFDTAAMTTSQYYDCSLNTCYGGGVWLVANKAFDISSFSSLTVNYNNWQSLNGNTGYNGVYVEVGLTQTGNRYTDNTSDNDYVRLGGIIDDEGIHIYSDGNNRTVTLDLTYAKTKGNQFYPFIRTRFLRGDGTVNQPYVHVKINSITFQ